MKTFSTILIILIVALGFVIILYSYIKIDFIGHKDPQVVAENLKRWDNMLLSAEYRRATDYYEVRLLDSVNIELNIGDNAGGVILTEKYKIVGDTILLIMNGYKMKDKAVNKYLENDKLIIKNDKLLFKVDNKGLFDTTTVMKIIFNKIKI